MCSVFSIGMVREGGNLVGEVSSPDRAGEKRSGPISHRLACIVTKPAGANEDKKPICEYLASTPYA